MRIEEIARVAHQVNKAYCESLGDFSQVDWEQAPEWQRQSAFNGVIFQLQNPDAPASASHESWAAQKIAEGWGYGPVKDPEKKQHPCLMPFDLLPPEQKAKDHLFKGIVAALKAYYVGTSMIPLTDHGPVN